MSNDQAFAGAGRCHNQRMVSALLRPIVIQPVDRGLLVGTGSEILAQLDELVKAGVQRVMLQWLDLDDLDGLQALASVIIG